MQNPAVEERGLQIGVERKTFPLMVFLMLIVVLIPLRVRRIQLEIEINL